MPSEPFAKLANFAFSGFSAIEELDDHPDGAHVNAVLAAQVLNLAQTIDRVVVKVRVALAVFSRDDHHPCACDFKDHVGVHARKLTGGI